MDDVKLRLNATVAGELCAAPASAEKDELIEELSDNLYRRFLDMTGAGVPEEEAFQRALDDLGDVDELLSYLGVGPDGDVTIDQHEGQTRVTTKGGESITVDGGGEGSSRIVINGPNGHRQTIVYGGGEAAQEGASAAQREAGTSFEGDPRYGYQPEGSTDAHGDTHHDYSARTSQDDLDAILAGVTAACNTAIDQAKEALKQAKDAIQRRTTVQRDNGHVKVHFNTHPDGPTPPTPPTPPEPPAPPAPPAPPTGWEFEAELDPDEGRFFASAGPKERKDVIYGFGYDKAKGGFFTQWGEWKGGCQGEGTEPRGPYFTSEAAAMKANDDGSYSVTALRDLRGLEVHTTSGDVSIHVSEAPDAGVIIDGDVDELDVTCSADGVLTIREGRTASSSFFSRRGFCSADVELLIPRRHWETIHVTTASGDVDIDQDGLDIDQLTVQTGNGDLSVQFSACGQLHFKSGSGDLDAEGPCGQLFAETMSGDIQLDGPIQDAVLKSASGDIQLDGGCARLHAETVSGDIQLEGRVQDAVLKSASGDIQLDGAAVRIAANSVSGDVQVETDCLPEAMDLSSKSGDCQAVIPDAGPFSTRLMTTSGEIRCQFHMDYADGTYVYGDGSGPAYSLTTISGDVSLDRH